MWKLIGCGILGGRYYGNVVLLLDFLETSFEYSYLVSFGGDYLVIL